MSRSRLVVGAVLTGAFLVLGAACTSSESSKGGGGTAGAGGADSGDSAGPGSGAAAAPDRYEMPDCTQAGAGGAGAAYPIISDAEYADEFRMRVVGEVSFEGETYSVVNAMPFDYLVSHVQRDRAFPTTETDDYYAVESDFELPYIPCVMDEVAWTPGPKNKGWASDLNTDPADAIADLGSGRPFLYHV